MRGGPRRTTAHVVAPLSGTVVALADVPDPVYADGVLGPGLAIRPDLPAAPARSLAVAPCAGRVSSVYPHAVLIEPGGDRSVLLHLGVAGARPAADVFDALTSPGRHVQVGQPVLSWSPHTVEAAGGSVLVHVVALRAAAADVVQVVGAGDSVREGQTVLLWS